MPGVGEDVTHLMGRERPPDFKTTNKPILDSVMDFGKEALAGFNPKTINQAIQSAFWHPIKTAKSIGAAQDVPRQKALKAFEQGNAVEGVRHLVDWLIPFLGPRLDQAGDFMQQGEIAKGLGATTDVAAQLVLPKVAGKVAFNAPRLVSGTKNAADAAAVAFGKSRGVLVDAGTELGSPYLKSVQKKLEGTWGGSNPVQAGKLTQEAGLTRVGEQLADQVHPTAVQPVQAGEGVRDSVAQVAQNHAGTANQAYDFIRRQEAANPVRFTVDITREKAALKPLYTRLAREAEIAPGSVMGDKATALKALDRLLNGPDVTRLTVLDEVVGDLRSLSGANNSGLMAEARSAGQGIAAQMVKQLDAKVKAAARAAGPDVIAALEDGRAATAAKFEALDVADLLTAEPRRLFDALTARKDGGINKLRAVAQVAPDTLPTLGRAVLEDMLDYATNKGGFKGGPTLDTRWQTMGGETKRMLFGPRVSDLDNFFHLAAKLTENVNPSGTGTVVGALNVTQILSAVPFNVLARILYSPKGAQTLTTAMRISANTAPAAQALAAAQVVRAAKAAGVTLPAAADRAPQP